MDTKRSKSFSNVSKKTPPTTTNSNKPITRPSSTTERFIYKCDSCTASFTTQFLLNCHVKRQCNKKASCTLAPKKRLSFKVKKDFIKNPCRSSPRKPASASKTVLGTPNNAKKKMSSPAFIVTCDACSKRFTCCQQLFRHKVIDHGMETPDKNIKNADVKDIKIPKRGHGGVLPSRSLRNAFANIRMKLAE